MTSFARFAAGIALSAGLATVGQATGAADQIATYKGRDFVCTGVGKEAQANPRWDRFPLKMVFTNVDGDYLGDVSVKVVDSRGKIVLAADCGAPWFLADLDAGRYTAKAVARDTYEQTVTFEVEKQGQTQLIVPFKQITDT